MPCLIRPELGIGSSSTTSPRGPVNIAMPRLFLGVLIPLFSRMVPIPRGASGPPCLRGIPIPPLLRRIAMGFLRGRSRFDVAGAGGMRRGVLHRRCLRGLVAPAMQIATIAPRSQSLLEVQRGRAIEAALSIWGRAGANILDFR